MIYLFLIIWPFHWVKRGQYQKGKLWVYETPIIKVIVVTLNWELICRNKWHSRTSEISTAPEIAVGRHFHTWSGTRGTPLFLPAVEETLLAISMFSLLTIKRHSATRKQLFLYPEGDRSGLRNPKKDKHQH